MASPGGGQWSTAHWIQTDNPSWGPHPQNAVRSKPPRSGSNLASTPPGLGREARVRIGFGGDADDADATSPPAKSTSNHAEARPAIPPASHPLATRPAPRNVAADSAGRRGVVGGGAGPDGVVVGGAGGSAGEVDDEARALLAELKEVTTTNRALQMKTRWARGSILALFRSRVDANPACQPEKSRWT